MLEEMLAEQVIILHGQGKTAEEIDRMLGIKRAREVIVASWLGGDVVGALREPEEKHTRRSGR